MNTYIKGNFRKYIFKSDKGYVIGLFKVKETNSEDLEFYINHTITFTGYFHELNEDDTYLFYGKLTEHEKYGEQFQVESYERVMPEEKDSIVEFLSSGLFKGIGEKKAKKIVDYLGKDTLNIILENPNNLLLIPTITKTQINILHDTLVEYEASYKTVLNLSDLGFSTKDSLIIYNHYKQKTMDVIEKNIYLLMEDIEEISFKKVDSIALNQEIKRDDKRRIMASILYAVSEVCNLYGHSYLLKEEIFSYVIRVLGNEIGNNDFEEAILSLIQDLKIINEEEKYYLKEMYEAEQNIVKRCGYLMRKEDNLDKKLDKSLKDIEDFFMCQYNNEQLTAIKNSFIKNILIITGGPGTGKTTIIKAICELYKTMNNLKRDVLQKEVALLAPTGRASKRISESTSLGALTIHRFLKWNKEGNYFAVNEHNKSDVKLVIIDEFSMVDTILFNHLLKGLRYDTKIIIVGDYHQLPSVGPGQLLKDFIESKQINTIELKELYRQKEGSNIISLAYQMKDNQLESTVFNQEEDLQFLPVLPSNLKKKVIEIATKYKETNEKIQILAPMYKTLNGIDNLNLALQEVFNKKEQNKKEIIINGILYREQDKVIQLTNMPDENVFNGDIGYIEEIVNGTKKEILIDFDGNRVRYTSSNFNKFKHAYAISIHKSQGSEFDVVILPIMKEYGKMLYRKLVYTAVTRAKKKLYLIGDYEALEWAVQNNDADIRKTNLKNKLIENIEINE
ncbi:MAG: ATP-dependent RecD-like DNA helicase [Firmicutes bacterium]|nr:ATP-dependent RecD-like DNA helicase [Bacillota bacterium]